MARKAIAVEEYMLLSVADLWVPEHIYTNQPRTVCTPHANGLFIV
jgi:hypothetical protein